MLKINFFFLLSLFGRSICDVKSSIDQSLMINGIETIYTQHYSAEGKRNPTNIWLKTNDFRSMLRSNSNEKLWRRWKTEIEQKMVQNRKLSNWTRLFRSLCLKIICRFTWCCVFICRHFSTQREYFREIFSSVLSKCLFDFWFDSIVFENVINEFFSIKKKENFNTNDDERLRFLRQLIDFTASKSMQRWREEMNSNDDDHVQRWSINSKENL